jgi:hypothetical protein
MTLLVCVALAGMDQEMRTERNTAGPTAVLSGTVTLNKADFVQSVLSLDGITSTDWVDMMGMAKTFKISGAGRDEAIVLFQAEWDASSDFSLIRLLIDNEIQGQSVCAHAADGASTSGFVWTTSPLKPNVTHTAKIQWKTVAGAYVETYTRSMVILHR